jgi:hypothetical protein
VFKRISKDKVGLQKGAIAACTILFSSLFAGTSQAAPFVLTWQQSGGSAQGPNGGPGRATATVDIDLNTISLPTAFGVPNPAWLNGGNPISVTISGTNNNGTFNFSDVVFDNNGIAFNFNQNLIGQNGWGTPDGLNGDFNLFNGSPSTWSGSSFFALSDGTDWLVLTSFLQQQVIPFSTLQPYADIQSIGLDALKNQRELVLNTAGDCDQRGWVVYDSDKVKDTNKTTKAKKKQSLCVFAEGGYATGSINGSSTIGGYNTSNASSAYGVEWKPSKQWAVGAAYGYGTANLGGFNFQDTSAYINSNINSASVYGVYRPDKNWKVAALAGYSNFNYTGSRTYLGDTANSSFGSNGYTAAIQATYDIKLNKDYNNKKNPLNPARIKPLVGLAWGGNQQAGFSETGDGTLLNVQGQTTNSLMGTIGAAFEAPIPLNKKKTTVLTPRIGVAYQYDFLANQTGNKSITAALQEDTTTSFTELGQNRGPNSIYLDLGTDLQINPQVALYASVNYQAFTNGNQLGYQGGVRVKF